MLSLSHLSDRRTSWSCWYSPRLGIQNDSEVRFIELPGSSCGVTNVSKLLLFHPHLQVRAWSSPLNCLAQHVESLMYSSCYYCHSHLQVRAWISPLISCFFFFFCLRLYPCECLERGDFVSFVVDVLWQGTAEVFLEAVPLFFFGCCFGCWLMSSHKRSLMFRNILGLFGCQLMSRLTFRSTLGFLCPGFFLLSF